MHSSTNPISSFSPTGLGKTVDRALYEWKAARTLLSDALQSYLAASATLRAVCTSSSHQPPEYLLVEEALTTVDSELDSLAEDAKCLFDMRISLATMRNRSTTLAQINTLPPEILAYIFELSGSSCALNYEDNLYDIMGVCAYWRGVVLHTADLWTHIDIDSRTLDRINNLLLERAKGYPIYLHVYEAEPDEGEVTQISKAIEVLAPYVSHACILDLKSYSWSGGFVGAVLNLWLENGTGSLSKSLIVNRPNGHQTLSLSGSSPEDKRFHASLDNAKGMLVPLSTLHLQRVKFDWNSGAYRNLIDLRLDFELSPVDISVLQLADILSSSPRLTILKLRSLEVLWAGDLRQFAPITLGYLEVFYLNCHSLHVGLLLSLITLSGTSTELGLYIQGFDQIMHPLQAFFARSKIATLYWPHYGHSLGSWLSISQSIPHLQTLVLDWLNMRYIEIEPPRSPSLAFSRVDCAVLLSCAVSLEGLKTLISLHGIRIFRLERCTVIQGEERDLHDVRSSLLEAYPELECSISDTDSTWNLPCRAMFDR
ncbi:hypothetical protein FRC12_021735 [Ceratobasidium sp. 428]|nr:hypothetical protein FRC12_021735 [Ceratobasidium sp. 428]